MNSSFIHISKRYIRLKNYKSWSNKWLPFKWERPEVKQGYFDTGDKVEKIEVVDPNRLIPEYEDAIKEIGNVPQEIQNMFVYGFMNRRMSTKVFRDEMIKKYSEYDLSNTSIEGRIIELTNKIRTARAILRSQPNNVLQKILINNWNFKRLNKLIELKKFNKEKFYSLLNDLEIEEPVLVMGEIRHNRVERKRELRRLTKEYCDNIINEKLLNYHEILKKEQKEFHEEKKKFEEWALIKLKEINLDENYLKNLNTE